MNDRKLPGYGFLVCLIVVCLTHSSQALVVSEMMYHPVDEAETLEFIELYNDQATTEDLSGCAFINGIEYTFAENTKIGPKSYLVVARDPMALMAHYGIADVIGPYTGSLSNSGERIELANENGGVFFSFKYNDAAPWPVSPDGTGHSLILAKLSGDPDEGTSWSASTLINGTPGAPDQVQVEPEDPTVVNLVQIGHAGRYFEGTTEPSPSASGQPTTAWTELGFNDNPASTAWHDGPSGYGYSNDASELQYIKTQLAMSGNYISVYARLPFTLTADQVSAFSQLQARVHYDDGYVLYLNGTRVADSGEINGNPPAHDQSGGSASDPPEANVDLTQYLNLLVPGTNVLAIQAHNATLSGSSDCMGSPELYATIVPQVSAGDDPRARIVINELLANSDADPGLDWIELYNPGPEAVNLKNVYLSDDRLALLKYKIPDGTVLQSGAFWSVSQGMGVNELPFGLDYLGETLYVTVATDGPVPQPIRVMDAVRYGNMAPDVTFGRFPNGAAHFDRLTEPTPGASNASPVIGDIVINEIMYHHGLRDSRYEYIELHNRSDHPVSMAGWALTNGIDYEFSPTLAMPSGAYLVVAQDPNVLAQTYPQLVVGVNLVGPYAGSLNHHSECIRLSRPLVQSDPITGQASTYLVTEDEVTYYDGGRWPTWADGQGTSLELRNPDTRNDTPDAWADSDESAKAAWEPFSFQVNSNDTQYSHDRVTVFDLMLLNQGEVLLDDLECIIDGVNVLSNAGFEAGDTGWRMLGNHIRSFVTGEDRYSGSNALHLVATGHGDPGANRINQSLAGVNARSVILRGKARWLKGSHYLLLRTTRENSPIQPPRPAHSFDLTMPMNQGSPGLRNTAYVVNRGPDILDVTHTPVLPAGGEPIVVSARITGNEDITAFLYYRSEGAGTFANTLMIDDGTDADLVAGDGLYTGTIPGASGATMRAFYIEAKGDSDWTRFPARLDPSAQIPDRTCLVRVGDSVLSTQFATYRVWLSNDVINAFRSRPTLSNELMDCTFVYNDSEVFYNVRLRFRGSPFLRSGFGRDPRDRSGFRIDFNPDQKFRSREEVNLDNTEGSSRGPLQERASYWFYRHMGLQYSRQEYIRPILNGNVYGDYEDVQKIDGDYIAQWFPDDTDGDIHKIDDYFEYTADGTGFSNLDEGLNYDARHPQLPETYRWGFEKRSNREHDNWDHLLEFAKVMNTPSNSPGYEQAIESVIHPEHFARVLALRHAVGDWDSYGYTRGKNNCFYYSLPESKWYLLPWDIDFTLGSGSSATENLFNIGGQFPEVRQFLEYPKYRRMYLQAFAELVNGPWQTSYGTTSPPTAFDEFLDDAANAMIADGLGVGRRDSIKQFVRSRRAYIQTQVPSLVLEITTNNGDDYSTENSVVEIKGLAPLEVSGIAINGVMVPAKFSGNNEFSVTVTLEWGDNQLDLQGLDSDGNPVTGATDSITIIHTQPCKILAVVPYTVPNHGVSHVTIYGEGFQVGTVPDVIVAGDATELGFDALYVQNDRAFDRIDAATLLLNDPSDGVGDEIHAAHQWINLSSDVPQGEFVTNEQSFVPPYDQGGENHAIRFSGYLFAASPGPRYFGVNSDDGFSLHINDQLVGEYADIRGPATTDVTGNSTQGNMTFDFPAAGVYPLVLDFFQNGGGEAIELFQTNATGGDRRLINVDSELLVVRDSLPRIKASNVVVTSSYMITCDINFADAPLGVRNVIVSTPWSECRMTGALKIVDP